MPLEEIQDAIGRLSAPDRKALAAWILEKEGPPEPRSKVPPKPIVVRTPVPLRRAVLWTLLSLIAFFFIDAALFRSGWYLQYLEPNSTAGQLELSLYWLTRATPTVAPEVMVVGDSRIAEGFSSRVAAASVQDRMHFWNMGIGGTSPRTWYYLIRDADPTRTRFSAIVLPLDHYADVDGEPLGERESDLSYVIGRLRVSDCFSFAQSMDKSDLYFHVFASCLFKGLTLRQDLKDLLAHRSTRLPEAGDWRRNGAGYIAGYGGKPEEVTGLTADFVTRKINFPPGLNDVQRSTIQGTVMPQIVPQTGDLTRYRQLWLGKILDLYANSPTKIIFIEIPRAPLPKPDSKVPAAFIDSVRNRRNVYVVPKDLFRDLEKPELFADGLHLNHNGRPIFSERLAAQVFTIAGSR